jgi:hypothetical protein
VTAQPDYTSSEHFLICGRGYCPVHDADPDEPGGYRFEKSMAEFNADYLDDLCESFWKDSPYRQDQDHWPYRCRAPHCPYPPMSRVDVELVPDESLGSRDELLTHTQRCADREMSYEEIYAEAYRVARNDRPSDPWRDKDIVPMIKGALRKAPAHIAENRARADADEAMLKALGFTPPAAAPNPGPSVIIRKPRRVKIQWPQ